MTTELPLCPLCGQESDACCGGELNLKVQLLEARIEYLGTALNERLSQLRDLEVELSHEKAEVARLMRELNANDSH